jgi:hypothetical protein
MPIGVSVSTSAIPVTITKGEVAQLQSHTHWVEHVVTLPTLDDCTTAAADNIYLPLDFLNGGSIEEVFGSVETSPASTALVFRVEKCTQANLDGTPSWTTILSTNGTIAVGERTTAGASGVDPVVSVTTFAKWDHLRLYIVTGNATAKRLTVTVRLKVKNV